MDSKAKRLSAIQNIITKNVVSSQDELLQLLKAQGFETTQATLSRDLKFLKVAKIPHIEKGYIYELPATANKVADERISDFANDGVISIDFSSNMAVIKTRPGFAGGIASIIDNYNPFEVLGTIAGDDTILLINREGVSRSHIIDVLSVIIPTLKDKIL